MVSLDVTYDIGYRKANGIYYTPEVIVDYMVSETVGRLVEGKCPEEINGISIVDPACGDGNFLVGVYKYLVEYHKKWYDEHKDVDEYKSDWYIKDGMLELTETKKQEIVLNNIYGVDIDQNAINHAKIRMVGLVGDIDLSSNIKCGNSLIGTDYFSNMLFYDDALWNEIKPFDWHKEFPKVFQNGGFDIVIGNPPYIDSEGMLNFGLEGLRKYISANYSLTKGNWDIYVAFFEQGFKLLNATGILTYITPDKWISKPFGDELRKNTVNNIYSILKAGREIFEGSKIDAIVSFFIKNNFEKLKIFDFKDNKIIFKREINKKVLKSPFAFDFLFSNYLELLIKIETIPNKKLDSFNCENACATSDAYKLEPLIKDLLNNKFDRNDQLKVINTGTISKYVSKWGIKEMTYLGSKYLCPVVNKREFLKLFNNSYAKKSVQSKIIIKGLNLLDACLDLDGSIIPGKTTLIIANTDTNELKFLSAILNSKLTFFYIKEKYPASSYNKGINFTPDMINNLPVPQTSKTDQKPFIELVDKILSITKDDDYFNNSTKQAQVKEYERQIDQMVYKLYGLTDEEIKIVEG